MGYLSAAVFPVLPGQKGRVQNWAQEVAPHIEEFERLNREGTFSRFAVYLQETPMGDFAIYAFEVEDPSRVRQKFTDTPYDTWYLDFLRDVHGVDIRATPEVPGPPPQVYEWKQT